MNSIVAPAYDLARHAAGVYLHILPIDFLRYALGAGGVYLIVNILLRRRLSGRKIRQTSPDWSQMRREIAASLRTVLIFAAAGLTIYGGITSGVLHLDERVSVRGWGWFAINLALLLVLHDAWFYWTHRLIHHPKLFRRFHRLHHRSHNPSPWTAYSFDPPEAVINAVFLPLALAVVPSSHAAVFAFLSVMIVKNAVGHSGYEIFPSARDGRPLIDWMTSVTHHDLHHAQAGWNYGLYFTWWDRLMGTEHPLYHEKFAAAVRTPLDGSAKAAIGHHRNRAMLVAALSLALFSSPASSFAAADESGEPAIDIAGVWATQGHGAHVRLSACAEDAGKLCGDLVWSWDSKIAAGPLLAGFVWDGTKWRDGRLENPEDGRTYRGSIAPQADGSLNLKGCALVFCKSEIWRRLEDIPGCLAFRDNKRRS